MKRAIAVLVSIFWLALILGGGYLVVTGSWDLLPASLRELAGLPSGETPAATPTGEPAVVIETPTPESVAPVATTPAPTSTPTTEPTEIQTPSATEPAEEQLPGPTAPAFTPVAVIELAQLRSGPGEDFPVVGSADAGMTVAVVGQDPTGEWYQLLDGTWIPAQVLATQPPVAVVTPTAVAETPSAEVTPPAGPTPTPVTARVNADANLRAGPGTEYERVGGVRFNEEVRVVGKSPDGQWYLLDTGAWLFAALIDETLDVPVVTPEGQPVATETPTPEAGATPVTNTIANLRAGPGTEYDVVETVPAGTALVVVGRNEAGDWLKLDSGAWIFAALVDNVPTDLPVVSPEEATPTPEATATEAVTPEATPSEAATPEATPTEEATPEAAGPVTRVTSNLRSGPGLDFPVVRTVPAGTPLTIVGRNDEGDWLKLEDGTWIAFILVDNVPADLPVVSPEEITPTPEATAEATPTEEAAPTEEATPEATPTEEAPPEATPTEEVTPTPETTPEAGGETTPQPVVRTDANLRAGPGTEYERVGGIAAGTPITVVGRNEAGDWLKLEDGTWIFAELVDNVPPDLPVVEP